MLSCLHSPDNTLQMQRTRGVACAKQFKTAATSAPVCTSWVRCPDADPPQPCQLPLHTSAVSETSHLQRQDYVLTAVNRLCRVKLPVSQRADFCKQLSVSSSSLRTLTYSCSRDYSSYIHLWYLANANVDLASGGQSALDECTYRLFCMFSSCDNHLFSLREVLSPTDVTREMEIFGCNFQKPAQMNPVKVLQRAFVLGKMFCPRDTRHPSSLLLSLLSTFCLFVKEGKKETSGRGLNCTSLSLRRDPGHLWMSLGLLPVSEARWFWPLMRTRPPRKQWLEEVSLHLSPGRCSSPSQGNIVIASLELKTDEVRPCIQLLPTWRSNCVNLC